MLMKNDGDQRHYQKQGDSCRPCHDKSTTVILSGLFLTSYRNAL